MIAFPEFNEQYQQILTVFVELEKQYVKSSTSSEYFAKAHQLLNTILYAENFFIVLYDKIDDTIQYVYNVDLKDELEDPNRKFSLPSSEQSPTAWVIRNKRELYFTDKTVSKISGKQQQWGQGPSAKSWLGVPMMSPFSECIGAVVIQSYEETDCYSTEQIQLFSLFVSMISNVIEKFDRLQSLETQIDQSTEQLKAQLHEQHKAEKLQRALFKIASLTNENLELYAFYEKIHAIVNEVLFAKNFYIALYDEEKNEISLPYFCDSQDGNKFENTTMPLGAGITSYVIKHKRPCRFTPETIEELIKNHEMDHVIGDGSFTVWLGAPLITGDHLHGIIVIQSYDPKIIYTDSDLEILTFVANHVATAIKVSSDYRQQIETRKQLAEQHQLLENQNNQLFSAFKQLKATQRELIQQEKMASLGQLVAGVAHEINTPLGVCVTAVSHLREETQDFSKVYANGQLSRKIMEKFLTNLNEIVSIVETNSRRASDLIHSFKQVAVDQSTDNARTIHLKRYLNEVVTSLQPKFKKNKHKVIIDCDESIVMHSNAGALSQVLTNLIINSLIHGFEEKNNGLIQIDVSQHDDEVYLNYSDDGVGVDDYVREHLFDPFFTTKRGAGGSGLGTHLVYNLVTASLKGSIKIVNKSDAGLSYQIKMPCNI